MPPTHKHTNHDQTLSKEKTCSFCLTKLYANSIFCHKCGSELKGHYQEVITCQLCQERLLPQSLFCHKCGHRQGQPSISDQKDIQWGERKTVTVLFADVVGFTKLTEQMDPEDVRDMMDRCFKVVSREIKIKGGNVNKYIGDAVLAIFGAPLAHDNDPERAVNASLDIQKALKDLNQEMMTNLGVKIHMRIGLNTGKVLAGYIGDEEKREYTVMGDTVNLASRLESCCRPDQVLISNSTFRAIRNRFKCKSLDPINLKGKSEPVATYEVLYPLSGVRHKKLFKVHGVITELIGRKKEFDSIKINFNQSIDQKSCQIVTVIGSAGMGKSRLAEEYRLYLNSLPYQVNIEKGFFTQDMAPSFKGFADIIKHKADIRESDQAEKARVKLLKMVGNIFAPEDPQEQQKSKLANRIGKLFPLGANKIKQKMENAIIEENTHFIGQLIGLDFPGSPYIEPIKDDPRQILMRSFRILAAMFNRMAEKAPMVIFLEDIHWAQNIALELINFLCTTIKERTIFFFCLARPELYQRSHDWGRESDLHTMLDLKPLTENDILEFGRQILHKMETIPSRLLQIIKSHSEGNPFFVEEIIKNFIEDGVIEISENDRIWKANEDLLDLSAVPNTIEGVVQARLDRLPPDEKMIIQKGSAIGRVFWIGALKAMDESAAEKALDKLQDKELVFQKSTSSFEGDREYIFKHQLTQMVAYENTLKNLRRLYHEIIGKWLIEVSGERIDEYYSMIANHFEKAKNWETAFAYYAKAGDQAKDIYTNKGAIDHYKLGLSLLQKLVHTPKNAIIAITMHEGLADVYQLVGDYDEAIRQYQNALDTLIRYNSDQPGSGRKVDRKEGSLSLAEARAEFTRKTGWVYHKKGDFDRAIELFKQAQNYLSDQHKKISARIYADQGYTAQSKGEYEKAIVWCLKGLEIVDGTDNYRELGRINSTLGRVYWLRGDFKSAMTYYSSSLEIFKKIGDIHGISQCYNNMGIISDLTGNFKRAIDYYKQSLEMREQIGDVDGIAMNYNNLGLIYFNQGNFTNAIKYYNKSLELFIRLGNNYRIATLYNNLGEVYCEQGNHPQAISFLERAIDICLSINARQFLPDPYRILAEVFLSLGQLDRTNNFCQTSLEIALKIGSREYEAIVYRVMGELFFHQEEWETSSEYFEKSIRMLLDLGLKIELGKTYYSYAVALKELRHLPSPKKVQKDLKTKSRLYLQEALEIFKQIDNLKMLSKIKNAL